MSENLVPRRKVFPAFALSLGLLLNGPAAAQDAKAIHVIVPLLAGSGTDVVSRTLVGLRAPGSVRSLRITVNSGQASAFDSLIS